MTTRDEWTPERSKYEKVKADLAGHFDEQAIEETAIRHANGFEIPTRTAAKRAVKGAAMLDARMSHTQEELEAIAAGGAELLDAVHGYLCRFVAYPSPDATIAHTLWIAHTHLMDAWESTPRIAFLSPEPGSGKTRALEITETLGPSTRQSINATPAYLFRKVSDPEDCRRSCTTRSTRSSDRRPRTTKKSAASSTPDIGVALWPVVAWFTGRPS